MKKEELIAKLTGVKEYTNTVSIDFVLAALGMLEKPTTKIGLTQELADGIANKIESCLDNNSDDLVDLDSAEFELNYDNRIELSRAEVNVSEIMEHIVAIIDNFVNVDDEKISED
jgi:hypothetical protein